MSFFGCKHGLGRRRRKRGILAVPKSKRQESASFVTFPAKRDKNKNEKNVLLYRILIQKCNHICC